MPNVELASNSSAVAGKWVPYYFKPFMLGRVDDGLNSTDGGIYITQTAGGTDAVFSDGACFSSHNCSYYYTIEVLNTSTDGFKVTKYSLNDTEIETIWAGLPSYQWDATNLSASSDMWITIDIGVAVRIHSFTDSDVGDIYKITLPTFEQMEKRKIYHGGFATFIKMPDTPVTAYHTDIIPMNLKDKSISVSFNPAFYVSSGTGGSTGALGLASSSEDIAGNQGISLSFAWNVNPSGVHAEGSGDTSYSWASGETWSYGSNLVNDANPSGLVAGPVVADDFPTHIATSITDTIASSDVTGTAQTANATTSGRAGHAKIRAEYWNSTGTEMVAAANQFWPLILTFY
mgnify:CR=1 FL=1|tara:strand:- start:375 stop:1409 length:1035 start_codon:yes stop_codon:yes gene_type:complete